MDQRKTKNLLFTHLSREYDSNHTSWAEIEAFSSLINNNLLNQNCNKVLADYKELIEAESLKHNHINQFDQIYIFATGQLNNDFKYILNSFKGDIYLIIQDPNWPVQFEIDRNFDLITPFKKWDNENLNIIKSDINQLLDWSLSNISYHHYIPFGLMLEYNDEYIHKYKNIKPKINIFNKNYIYAGSLKKDRKNEFIQAIKNYDVAFYGNFTNTDLLNLTNLQLMHNSVCMGKVSPYQIPYLYSIHGKPILMPDYLMLYFNVSYIRYFEIYLSQILNNNVKSLFLSSNNTNYNLGINILKNFSNYDYSTNLFTINKYNLISYFENNQSLLFRIKQLIIKGD